MFRVFGELRNLALLDFLIQWVMWAYSAYHRTEKYYDLTGSITYVALITLSYLANRSPGIRQTVQTAMVLAWAIRLGSYLFSRISGDGFDRRFNGVRDNPPKFFVFWSLQGVWVIVTLLPSLLLNMSESKRESENELNVKDYFGWALWIVGFAFEALADHQKSQFRAQPENKGKFINTGLWGISRHPNYFGEILMWLALYIPTTNVLTGWKKWACLLCPLFDVLLLTRISGIPLLEEYGRKKWGNDPNYRRYIESTAVLIPWIW